MKLDENRRELMEKIKEDEKQDAIKRIFSDEPVQKESLNQKHLKEEQNMEDVDHQSNASASEVNSPNANTQSIKPSKKVNEIWDEEAISTLIPEAPVRESGHQTLPSTNRSMKDEISIEGKVQPKVVPAVRNLAMQESVKLEFTEKIFPTLALRESQLKEAPAPKLRKLAQKMDKVSKFDSES
jgi:hypothetical protein